jgi:hypothetical protein
MLPGCPEARNDGFYVGKYGHAEPFHKEICRDDGDAVTYLVHIILQGNCRYKSSGAMGNGKTPACASPPS